MNFRDFDLKNIPSDAASGAISGIVAIPDAIASGLLAGVSPIYGFNALMTGTPIGSLFTSSQFMNIGLANAMMIAVGDALLGFSSEDLITAMLTLTVLIGVFQLILGVLKLGKFTQFVSNSVMIGFLTGVAVVVILGQVGGLTGYSSTLSGTIVVVLDTILHISEWNFTAVATSAVSVIIIVLLYRTRLKNFSMAIAMVAGTMLVFLMGWDTVNLVGDTYEIGGSFPKPTLPDLTMVSQLMLSAIAIGIIGLVQGSGVSQGIPNPDGDYPDASVDFSAQGIANIIAGFFRGLPLGGSLGMTGVVMSTGGRSRWANVFVGVFVIIFVLLFGNAVELVAMPTVAAILVVVGFLIIPVDKILDIWDIDRTKRIIMATTFFFTLILPVQQAVLIGVLISFLDFIYSSSGQTQLSKLRQTDTGQLIVEPVPEKLDDGSVTVLHARGTIYFAAARTLQDLLPSAKTAHKAVVILRMRGIEKIGSTLVTVLERYADELQMNDGSLMLSGVHENVMEQLRNTETTDSIPEEKIFLATEILLESTRAAISAAHRLIEKE